MQVHHTVLEHASAWSVSSHDDHGLLRPPSHPRSSTVKMQPSPARIPVALAVTVQAVVEDLEIAGLPCLSI